jgi:cytochrome c oxidase assembly protein subunit 15
MLVAKGSIAAKPFGLLVFLQGALIVTGGAVRLTGSGLGCPTWPECTPGSYTPVPYQAEGQLHAWIEFGNRLLTFALLFTAVAAVIIAFRSSKNAITKKRVRVLAALQILGILGQGVLGGITVLTGLHPITVAAHFLLSIFLISGAISLRYEMIGIIKQPPTGLIASLIPILIWLTLIVITVGTIVTGSGPHAGDADAERFGLDPKSLSWLHADFVIALLVLTTLLWLLIKQTNANLLTRKIQIFLLIVISQGLIGYIQYATGLPELIVGFHLLGAALVWGGSWSFVKVAGSGFKLKGFN